MSSSGLILNYPEKFIIYATTGLTEVTTNTTDTKDRSHTYYTDVLQNSSALAHVHSGSKIIVYGSTLKLQFWD